MAASIETIENQSTCRMTHMLQPMECRYHTLSSIGVAFVKIRREMPTVIDELCTSPGRRLLHAIKIQTGFRHIHQERTICFIVLN